MKKILFYIFIGFFIITPVYASENRLYFTEDDGQLYYESSLIDEKIFLNHLDMVPGDSFTDELIIENGTEDTHKIYFKVSPKEENANVREFFEYLFMKIYLDDELIYDGKIKGLDYNHSGVNLQDVVFIGEFEPGDTGRMVVETKLSEQYSNTNFNDNSFVDWTFYADYEKDPEPSPSPTITPNPSPTDEPINPNTDIIEILPIPNTGIFFKTISNYLPFLVLGIGVVLVILFRRELKK